MKYCPLVRRIATLRTLVLNCLAVAAIVACGRPAGAQTEADPLDWYRYRGPEQNGISRETGLVDRWDPAGGEDSNVLWKNDEAGGISTPIVMRGKLYTIVRHAPDTPREAEKVLCLDAATGKKIWENISNVYLSDVPAERIGWSHCEGDPATGNIYVQRVGGLFECIDGETGKTLWSHSMSERFGLLTTYGGRTNSPVIFEDLVIISGVITGWGEQGRPVHRFLGMDKKTGEVVWASGTRPLPDDTTYSTPVLTTLKGQAAMVFASGDGGIHAFQPRTGKPIWNFELSIRGISVSPVVENDRVYVSHAEENENDPATMGAVVAIDGTLEGNITKSGELWRAEGMAGKAAPLLIDGRLYVFEDGGKVLIFDAATGKPVGRPVKMVGTILRASPIYADGKIYACTTSGWHVFEPTKDGVKVVQRMRLPQEDEIAASPIVSHGKIYVTSAAGLYCLGTPDAKPTATARPELPAETPAGRNDDPAQVQVVPADVLMKPGKHQKFTVRLYNARGQFLRNATANFSVSGPGEINKEGNYMAPEDASHTAATLTAKVGNLQGQARIRIVPELPWKFDFSDGDIPVTWIGARYRHVARELEGEKVLVKANTIPKGTRSQSWMGHTDLHDYTIQADVRGTLNHNKMPDMGVIAQRYTFDLMGASQQVQIRSWTPQLARFSKSVPFAWEPNTWYTIKFRAATDGGKAVLKGKVWKRGEAEPKEWTIEAVDEAPNLQGSPGLFGNANEAEFYIDNVSITKNAS